MTTYQRLQAVNEKAHELGVGPEQIEIKYNSEEGVVSVVVFSNDEKTDELLEYLNTEQPRLKA